MIGDISETQKATIDTSIRLTLDMDAIAGLKTAHHWAYLPILGLVFFRVFVLPTAIAISSLFSKSYLWAMLHKTHLDNGI